MSPVVWSYLVYLGISLSLTVWVARSLFKNGRVFLVDCFGGNELLADSVNRLLVVGFHLVNGGYIALTMKQGAKPGDLQQALEFLTTKIGWVLLVLGAMHFFNLWIFSKLRHRGTQPRPHLRHRDAGGAPVPPPLPVAPAPPPLASGS